MKFQNIRCWIPSNEEHDLRTAPFLDGIPMTGFAVSKKELRRGYNNQHYRQVTGRSTARLYEFGRQVLTDHDDSAKPDNPFLNSLNTVKLIFQWGHMGVSKPRDAFYIPPRNGGYPRKSSEEGSFRSSKTG
ncbi:hypothetical protein OPQ81_009335 [Rhizoctonia solani]|nr:hypothetical protein OPQ81_009335 [Rhizoctonia solani]